ncbi:unnamed protein product [Toxocara canis]|uniref:Pyruvate dehydrogenase (acetyl-transferring) n=1 Tax=Toxocara canis TaxID=6265 RepID=A0A183U377_TOXCA|nr:unnamed protein product [Toxocara canis]
MVSSTDENWQLKLLDRERDTPREQIQQKVGAIVEKQPKEVQEAYKKLLLSHNAKDEAEYEIDMIVLRGRGQSFF